MRLSRRVSCLAFASFFLLAGAAQAQVRISQVYGGGGNSGATYKNDFIEIFNAGSTSQSLNGWSVQYASATGTSWSVTNLGNVTLAPGQYYLVQEAVGAGGTTSLPTPDATGSIAMSATAGKVVLRNSTTSFTGTSCPSAQDLVTFGATNCSNPVAALTNTTAALRKSSGCTNTDNNTNDFSTGAAAPRNTATAVNPCSAGTPTNPAVTASANPSSALPGEDVTIKATVVFGTNPASTGVAVVANLTPIGGSATQALYDDGAHGDGAAGDKVYGYIATVAAGTTAGTKTLGVGVADDQARSGSTTVNVNIISLLAIHDVQGNGNASPYAGQNVAVEGIVTARKSNGFMLQAPDAEADADPATSEAVFVFTSSAPSAAASVGNRVRVQGNVSEFVSSTNPHQLKITELGGTLSISTLSTGNALPTAIALPASLMQADSPIDALERYEDMRVSVATLNVVAPVGAFVTESSAASPSDGVFFGVLPGVARPFREPGIGALDTTPLNGTTPPVFDTNPERLRVQSTGQAGAIAMAVDVGDVVTGLVGVLDYGFGAYSLLPDPSAPVSVTPGATPKPVAYAKKTEITIGGFNLERFFDDVDAPGTSDAVLTTATYGKRLKKTANAICGYVRLPDILGVVEVENQAVLQKLADTINTGDTQTPGSCARNPMYSAHLMEGNDVGGIDVGFLLDGTEVAPGVPRVQMLDLFQIGKDTLFANPDGTTALLNDRPSLVLLARVNAANGSHYDVTVIANHLRSLTGVNDVANGGNGWASDGARIRAKRAAQAKFLADYIQSRQAANPGERIVLLGDFNAFEFNDGYADSMGVITGKEAGPTQVLNYVDSPITVPLTNMAELTPEADRYSFSFDGNAQSLDHMVVNQALLDSTGAVRAEHARINSDFGEDNYGDFSVPVRVSDHDPVVLYLNQDAFGSADVAVSVTPAAQAVGVNKPVSFGIGVANGGPDAAALLQLDLEIDAAVKPAMQPAAGWSCNAPVVAADKTTVHCSAATLDAGKSSALKLMFVAPPALGGHSVTVKAKVTTTTTDAAQGNNCSSGSTRIDAYADLSSTVRAPATTGGVLTKPGVFTVTARNAGPDAAHNAVLVIAVNGPKSVVNNLSGLPCQNASDTPSMSTWNCPIGSWYLSATSFSVQVTVDPAKSAADTISVGSGISSETADPVPGNNAGGAAVRVH